MIESGMQIDCVHKFFYGHNDSTSHNQGEIGLYRQYSDEFKWVAVARTLVDGASVRHSVLKLDLHKDARDLR